MSWRASILRTTEPDLKLWIDRYGSLAKKGIYHSPNYIKLMESHYRDEAELFLFGDENEFVYYPYFRRRLDALPFADECEMALSGCFDVVSSWYYGGPILQTDNRGRADELVNAFRKAFSTYCREAHIVSEFIRFDPVLKNHVSFEEILQPSKNRETVYVDLLQKRESIWANMTGRARTAIRKAKKLGVNIHVSDQETDVVKFGKIYAAEMERKTAPGHYLFSPEFIQRLFNVLFGRIAFIYAEIGGILFSGGLFVYEVGEAAHYYLMATDHDYQRYQANNLILHEAMLYFADKGIKILDLQGGREGVFRFKRSFSNTRADFYTCGIIHDRAVYQQLVSVNSRKCSKTDGSGEFFPAYRAKDTN